MYPGKQDRLSVRVLFKEYERRQHGNYKYLVFHCHTSFTAFRTKKGFKDWLNTTGLKVGKRYHAGSKCFRLDGQYFEDMQMIPRKQFDAQTYDFVVPWLENGSYSPAQVTRTDAGNVVRYMNCNCDREILPYMYNI